MTKDTWVHADFNGLLEPDLLCLSHADTVQDQAGRTIVLREGMALIAFDYDADEQGRPDNILAEGTVEPSPDNVRCRGSRWALRINERGIHWESDLAGEAGLQSPIERKPDYIPGTRG